MLAFEETGKYVSERHAEATASGKLTAGKMAAKLNRKFKPAVKIKAKELKPFASEWHDSGFYRGSCGSTMGRTYFFDASTDCEQLYKRICEAREEAAKVAAEPEVERCKELAKALIAQAKIIDSDIKASVRDSFGEAEISCPHCHQKFML